MLDAGRIVERGTHQQLLAKNGLYESMWNRQREAEAAREKLALAGEGDIAPNRKPPQVEDEIFESDVAPRSHASVDAAE